MNRDNIGFAALLVLIVVVGVLIYWAISYITCQAKWGDAGLPLRYGLISGCQAQVDGERWVPVEMLRDVTGKKP